MCSCIWKLNLGNETSSTAHRHKKKSKVLRGWRVLQLNCTPNKSWASRRLSPRPPVEERSASGPTTRPAVLRSQTCSWCWSRSSWPCLRATGTRWSLLAERLISLYICSWRRTKKRQKETHYISANTYRKTFASLTCISVAKVIGITASCWCKVSWRPYHTSWYR